MRPPKWPRERTPPNRVLTGGSSRQARGPPTHTPRATQKAWGTILGYRELTIPQKAPSNPPQEGLLSRTSPPPPQAPYNPAKPRPGTTPPRHHVAPHPGTREHRQPKARHRDAKYIIQNTQTKKKPQQKPTTTPTRKTQYNDTKTTTTKTTHPTPTGETKPCSHRQQSMSPPSTV